MSRKKDLKKLDQELVHNGLRLNDINNIVIMKERQKRRTNDPNKTTQLTQEIRSEQSDIKKHIDKRKKLLQKGAKPRNKRKL